MKCINTTFFLILYGLQAALAVLRSPVLGLKIITVAMTLAFVAPAAAQTIAVFPIDDLSQGINSPNFELTRFIAASLESKGMHVVDERDIISFMAAERVRWLGYLDTEHVLRARETLGADFILLGTICQKRELSSPAFGLSLHMLRARDAKMIWSSSGGLSLNDLQRLLGLNEPSTLAELWPRLVENVLAEWPTDLEELMQQALVFDKDSGEAPPRLQVEDVRLSPRYVRPGQEVKCVVRLTRYQNDIERPQIFIKVGSRVYLARQTSENQFYVAAWTGSEIEQGVFREPGEEALHLVAKDIDPRFFEGAWPSSDEDDVYPVSLILQWPNGHRQTAFVGTYTVDSTPPDMDMILRGNKMLDGLMTFRDQILILPKTRRGEPLTHWKLSVEDINGKILMADEGAGPPPEEMTWYGQNFDGFLAKDGIYRLVLKVWDRAGNEVETANEIAFRPNPPSIVMSIEKKDQSLQLVIDTEDKAIPLSYWRLEFWTENGDLVKFAEGFDLPENHEISLPVDTKVSKLQGSIMVRDVLGNKSVIGIEDMFLIAMGNEEDDNPIATEKVKKQKDDDSVPWLSQF
jgi:hypothetical protein